MTGWAAFEWARNGHFVVHSTGGAEQGSPYVHWMIGRDDASGTFAALYADSRGQSRIYEMSFSGDVWEMSRTASGSTQRFFATIGPDRKVIDARWESSVDRKVWAEEFALKYTWAG